MQDTIGRIIVMNILCQRNSSLFHPELKTLLIVYVDDSKMSGPKENLPKAWKLIRSKIRIEDPVSTEKAKYLGCERKVESQNGIRFLEYNMQGSLEKCIDNYKNLSQSVGYDCNLKNVKTPFVDEDALDREANNFLKDQECKHCGSQFWQQWLSKQLKKQKSKSAASSRGGGVASPSVSTCDGGSLTGSKCAGGMLIPNQIGTATQTVRLTSHPSGGLWDQSHQKS